jgi:hypothetical protein
MISWGQQVRSYVLAPYQLVKDHRLPDGSGNRLGNIVDGQSPSFETFLSFFRRFSPLLRFKGSKPFKPPFLDLFRF